MNKYIKVLLTNRNEIRCNGSFKIFGSTLDRLSIKIDTGCPFTSIPLKRTPLDNDTLLKNTLEILI